MDYSEQRLGLTLQAAREEAKNRPWVGDEDAKARGCDEYAASRVAEYAVRSALRGIDAEMDRLPQRLEGGQWWVSYEAMRQLLSYSWSPVPELPITEFLNNTVSTAPKPVAHTAQSWDYKTGNFPPSLELRIGERKPE